VSAETHSDEPTGATSARRRARGRGPSYLARTQTYYREIVAELRKVIYPTRSELLTYVIVVLVFVSVMVAIVAGLDYGFTRLDLKVFG
jgi:preprotein translocase subunit SecE